MNYLLVSMTCDAAEVLVLLNMISMMCGMTLIGHFNLFSTLTRPIAFFSSSITLNFKSSFNSLILMLFFISYFFNLIEVSSCVHLLLWAIFFNDFWWLIFSLNYYYYFGKNQISCSVSMFSPFNDFLSSDVLANVLNNLSSFF